jgi:hypothetical protein
MQKKKKEFNYCSTFCLYLSIIVQSWTNLAQKICLVIYNQTVRLVIFYLYLMIYAYVQRFDVMKRKYKNLQFGRHLKGLIVSE